MNRVSRLAEYFVNRGVSLDMFTVLVILASSDGVAPASRVIDTIKKYLSNLEIDHLLKKMEDQKLIVKISGEPRKIQLNSKGTEMVVESGLAALDKYINDFLDSRPF